MKCPTCTVDLVISSREGVEIDYCPQCRGVWLDRGELDKIIDRAAESMAPTRGPEPRDEPRRADRDRDRDRDRPRYDDDDYYDRGRGKRRRRSFLDDIFDIVD